MRILLIGANGQLARDLLPALAADEVVAVTHEQLEICNAAAVNQSVEQARPDCILNTAAYHRVDACEDEPERAFAVNGAGVYNLARAAERRGCVLVHISTDYVFDGAKRAPYLESDATGPLSVYAMSKCLGEWAVRAYCQRHFVIRTCGLYGPGGSASKGGNFPLHILRLARERKPIRVVNDQMVTPTSTRDLAEKLVPLIHTTRYGIYHMTNQGQCSWYEFAREVFRLAGVSWEIAPVSSVEFAARARRPLYSVLDNAALRGAGIAEFRPWQEAVADYVRTHRV